MTTTIKFSPLPGAYERHLQRKYHNPLFPASEHHLFELEVNRARERDQQDLHAFLETFEQVVTRTANLDSSVESEELLDIKQELERLYVQSASLAGDLVQYRQALVKLIEITMQTIRKGAADDPTAMRKLEEEEQARTFYFDLLKTPLVADLLRGEIVSKNDLVPVLLNESQDTLLATLALFDEEQGQELLSLCEDFIHDLTAEQRASSHCELRLEQIRAIVAAG